MFKSIHFTDPMVWTYLMPKAKNDNVYLRSVTLGAGLMEPHMRCDGKSYHLMRTDIPRMAMCT